MINFETKDSGKRQEYPTGMRRDLQEGKPRYDLVVPVIPEGCTTDVVMFKRWADLMARGAEKYGERNWELASTKEEYERFKASAFRHFLQWLYGEQDEDHAAAVMFNIQAAEFVKSKNPYEWR